MGTYLLLLDQFIASCFDVIESINKLPTIWQRRTYGYWKMTFTIFFFLSILLSSLYQTSINEMSFHGWLRYKSDSQNTLSSFQGHSWIWGYLKMWPKRLFFFPLRIFKRKEGFKLGTVTFVDNSKKKYIWI